MVSSVDSRASLFDPETSSLAQLASQGAAAKQVTDNQRNRQMDERLWDNIVVEVLTMVRSVLGLLSALAE